MDYRTDRTGLCVKCADECLELAEAPHHSHTPKIIRIKTESRRTGQYIGETRPAS